MHETDVGRRKETVISATLHITNGTDVEMWVRIFGFGASMSSRIFTDPWTVDIIGDKLFEPKSFALVYAHNTTQTRHPLIHMGARQPGDHLLKFDSKLIQRTSTTNFPESEFEYHQTDAYLTQVSFSFSVNVSFYADPYYSFSNIFVVSLQSPTAILFVNSTNIGDNNFDAVVYDLNRPEFTANMSVYGYFENEKPRKWHSIIP